jgi:addiction module HigA family antidote
MIPKHRKPTHPGEVLIEEFLKPKQMTQLELAAKMGVPIQRVNTLINGKRDMTPETAILLSRVFDTTPEFWMNLQTVHDLYLAQAKISGKAA